MGLFSFLFSKRKNKIADYLERDAVILDVRTEQEWDDGHVENAIHIPLNELNHRVDEIKNLNKPVIAYCKSGVRSEKAKQFLVLSGIDAINGGGCFRMKQILKQ